MGEIDSTQYSNYVLEIECRIAIEHWESISKSALLCCHMRSEGVGIVLPGVTSWAQSSGDTMTHAGDRCQELRTGISSHKIVETMRVMQRAHKKHMFKCLSALYVSNCMLYLNAIFYLAMKKNYGL